MCAKTQCCSYDDNFCMFADQECWITDFNTILIRDAQFG